MNRRILLLGVLLIIGLFFIGPIGLIGNAKADTFDLGNMWSKNGNPSFDGYTGSTIYVDAGDWIAVDDWIEEYRPTHSSYEALYRMEVPGNHVSTRRRVAENEQIDTYKCGGQRSQWNEPGYYPDALTIYVETQYGRWEKTYDVSVSTGST